MQRERPMLSDEGPMLETLALLVVHLPFYIFILDTYVHSLQAETLIYTGNENSCRVF